MSDLSWLRPKLAELCGWHRWPEDCHETNPPPHRPSEWRNANDERMVGFHDWRPDEDVAQAVRCLEALDKPAQLNNTTSNPRKWIALVGHIDDGPEVERTAPSMPAAICLAIAAALGWERDDAERGS